MPKTLKYKTANKLPKLKNYKTKWDLAALYYKNLQDPRIEKDLTKAELVYINFAKKWNKRDFTKSVTTLRAALNDYEALCANSDISRVGRYLGFRLTSNANDAEADKMSVLVGKRLRKQSDKIIFFLLTLGKIPKKEQNKFLNAKELAHFKYFLERIFLGSKHDLSEAEEKIIRLKSPQSYGNWVDAVDKIITNRKITFKNKELSIPEAQETLDLLSAKDKVMLWNKIITEMKQIGEVAEHEFNSIINDVRQEDELRGFKKPYSATALSYEDSEASLENLVAAVSTDGFKLSQKFYKLKAKYHKTKQLHYTQKYQSIGPDIKLPFPQALEIARDVFYSVNNKYGELFDNMFKNGQIDVFPHKGKRGGAFMSNATGHPIQVMLNHVDNFKSLETLAHEMGHAIHAARSAENSAFYDGHSIITAETASTLFENLLFRAVFAAVDEKQQKILLHDKIARDIATIQRQISFFNCELEIHNTIHNKGMMTNDELRACMYKHLKSYLGSAIDLKPEDGYSYVFIPHLRYGFYVYSYSYGHLMSNIMAERLSEDKSYAKQIDTFLSAGESANVSDIFKLAGINTKKPDVFTKALESHAKDIADFEKFTKN